MKCLINFIIAITITIHPFNLIPPDTPSPWPLPSPVSFYPSKQIIGPSVVSGALESPGGCLNNGEDILLG